MLIDSGDTHNFISDHIAHMTGLKPTPNGHLQVIVASGERLVSPGKYFQTLLNLQNNQIFVDFYLLPLEGYDVVLGTQ